MGGRTSQTELESCRGPQLPNHALPCQVAISSTLPFIFSITHHLTPILHTCTDAYIHMHTPLPKISSAAAATSDTFGSSSLEFSQLFNFLPLNGPCYSQAAGSALGLSYPAEDELSLAPHISQDPTAEPVGPLHTLSSTYTPGLSTHAHTHSTSLSTTNTI